MTGEEFVEIFNNNQHIREYILIQAKRHTKSPEQREDHVQEAWLAISCAPAGHNDEFYESVAYKAIYSSYWQLNKDRLITNAVQPGTSHGSEYDESQLWEIYATNEGVRRRDPTGRYL